MPVIIEPEDRDRWLDPDVVEAKEVSGLLVPAAGGILVRHPVDRAINTPRNDGPEIIEAVPLEHSSPRRIKCGTGPECRWLVITRLAS